MSKNEKLMNNKIIYNEGNFSIIPPINLNDYTSLLTHVHNLKNHYVSTDGKNLFFWTCSSKNIYVDEAIDLVENNIYEQFSQICIWLYERNYLVKGLFIYRTSNVIEYIATNGLSKTINHNVLVDQINLLNANDPHKIMTDAKNKIMEYIKPSENTNLLQLYVPMTISPEQPYYQLHNLLTSSSPNSADKEIGFETKTYLRSIQTRMADIENKFKILNRTNNYLWKFFGFAGILLMGSFCLYTYLNYGHEQTNNLPDLSLFVQSPPKTTSIYTFYPLAHNKPFL